MNNSVVPAFDGSLYTVLGEVTFPVYADHFMSIGLSHESTPNRDLTLLTAGLKFRVPRD